MNSRRYPGAKGRRRRVAPAAARAPAARETDFEPLLQQPAFGVEQGFGSSRRSSASSDPLRPMQVSQSYQSSADALLHQQDEQESSPLLGSRKSIYTPQSFSLDNSAPVQKAQQHLSRGRHHFHSIRSNHPPVNSRGSTAVVRGRNPARDLANPICSHGCCCCQCIRTNQVGVVEHFGQYQDLLGPGLFCMPWPCTRVVARMSLRIQQLEIVLETKSRDNVFLHLRVVVLYRVNNVYSAYYTLTRPRDQIKAYVLDVVRSTVPTMTVDEVFSQTSDVALSVLRRLQGNMALYGYEILDTLVTDITPNPLIKASMNEMNASKRIKDAMPHKAEAFKIKKLKDAEAAAEKSYLEGVGVANERKAIAHGMKQSLLETKGEISSKDVMDILLLSHYMDTLVAIGGNSMLLHSDIGEVTELRDQLSTYFVPNERQPAAATPQVLNIPDLLW